MSASFPCATMFASEYFAIMTLFFVMMQASNIMASERISNNVPESYSVPDMLVRQKRMSRLGFPALKGKLASEAILSDAKFLRSRHEGSWRLFEKGGGEAKAVKDFHDAKPTNIRSIRDNHGVISRFGDIGDRKISLHGIRGTSDIPTVPTVVISHQAKMFGKRTFEYTDTIRYTDSIVKN